MKTKSRTLFYFGDLTSNDVEKLCREIDELHTADSNTVITLILGSGGGNITPALAFYDFVRSRSIPLTVVASGTLAAAALIVWMSAKRRCATPNTVFGFHPSVLVTDRRETVGFIIDQRFTVKILDAQDALMARIIAHGTGTVESDIRRLMKEGHTMLTSEAVERGFLAATDVLE